MVESLFQLATGCVLQAQIASLEPTEFGWLLKNRVEVSAQQGCSHLDINLPPQVKLHGYQGSAKRFDGPTYKLHRDRFQFFPMDLLDRRRVRVHLPELSKGDRLVLDLSLQYNSYDEFTWQPGLDGTQWTDLRVHRTVLVTEAGRYDLHGNRLRLNRPEATDVVTLSHPNQDHSTIGRPYRDMEPPTNPVETRRTLTLVVPDGDPQVALWPGEGSKVEVEEIVHFAPEDRGRIWTIPLPREREGLAYQVDPEGGAEIFVREDDLLIVAVPSAGSLDVVLRYSFADAPTFAEVTPQANEELDLHVRVPGGTIAWEADHRAWWLQAIDGEPILPTREHLIRALQYRFNQVSYPEPAVPMRMRGAREGWDLVTALYETMQNQVVPATWPADHLWPRKLVEARKSGAVTSVEAALILRVYLLQSRIQADWFLVQPADETPIYQVVPTRYDEALLRVSYEGEERWLDPGCAWCAPFEIRPELQGAPALGQGLEKTPEPTPGNLEVMVDGGSTNWQLVGPPALLRRMSGQVKTESTEEFGTPLHYSTTSEPGLDDLNIAEWCEWVGKRQLIRPLPDSVAAVEADETHGPVHYRRSYGEGMIIEEWTVTERRLEPAILEALTAARVVGLAKGADAAPDDMDPPPAAPADSESPQ